MESSPGPGRGQQHRNGNLHGARGQEELLPVSNGASAEAAKLGASAAAKLRASAASVSNAPLQPKRGEAESLPPQQVAAEDALSNALLEPKRDKEEESPPQHVVAKEANLTPSMPLRAPASAKLGASAASTGPGSSDMEGDSLSNTPLEPKALSDIPPQPNKDKGAESPRQQAKEANLTPFLSLRASAAAKLGTSAASTGPGSSGMEGESLSNAPLLPKKGKEALSHIQLQRNKDKGVESPPQHAVVEEANLPPSVYLRTSAAVAGSRSADITKVSLSCLLYV
jgi:hypothetical protein